MNTLVSVVVPTYKRPDLLSRCLAALVTQEFDPSAFEIIIVDDAAEESTKSLVETWAQKPVAYSLQPAARLAVASRSSQGNLNETELTVPSSLVKVSGVPIVRYIPMQNDHGPAAARNTGWKAASGEIIAFTDDDCLPSPGWLKAGVAAFDDETMGVTGKIIMPIPLVPTDYERDASNLERSEFVTANCFYRRCALETIGGFDTRFKAAWREDSDLYFSMLEKNFQLRRAPDAIVVHPIRPARFGVSLSQQRKSQYNALIFKKHPQLYRERIQNLPPVSYYLTALSVLAFGAGLVMQNRFMMSGSALAWFLLTASFAIRRLKGVSHAPLHIAEMIMTSIVIPFSAIYWRLRGALRYRVFFW